LKACRFASRQKSPKEGKLHLPIVTRGATDNVNSLLYLRGVDAAIINTDALDEYKAQVPSIERRIVYLLSLFPSELHIFVRPEIMFIPHQVALEQMKRGELSAVVFVTSKPVDAFVKGCWESGFKFLAVEYDAKFEDYYLPSWIKLSSLMDKCD
jgi:hypothetical protein